MIPAPRVAVHTPKELNTWGTGFPFGSEKRSSSLDPTKGRDKVNKVTQGI